MIDYSNTVWMFVCTTLVALMTPAGMTLFYGGLARPKSVIHTAGLSYVSYCVTFCVWVVIGYAIAYSNYDSISNFLSYLFLNGVDMKSLTSTKIPTEIYIFYQGCFAAISVSIVTGSVIERVKYSTWIIFAILWVMLVYAPIAHWVWGNGFLQESGVLDYAGGIVVHFSAGISGLVLSIIVGKRKDNNEYKPSSIKMMMLGSALLLFGWYGFNGGSNFSANFLTAHALLTTNIAACFGGMSWLIYGWVADKKPQLFAISSGVIAGLVAITPCAGFVGIEGSIVIGIVGGIVGRFSVIKIKSWLGYDDALDAFGIHGIVGVWGAIAVGIFASPSISGYSGLLYGNVSILLSEIKAVVIVGLYAVVVSSILFLIIRKFNGDMKQVDDIDDHYHGERHFN